MSTYIIAEHKDNQVKKVTYEILGELLKQNVDPTVILLGTSLDGLAAEIAKKGAAKIALLESNDLKDYSPEGYANAIHAYLSSKNPTAIITGASSTGKDFLPRLAAKFQTGIAADCTEFKSTGTTFSVRRPVYAGKCSKSVSFAKSPCVFSVRPNVLAPAADNAKTPQIEKVAANVGTIRAKITQVMAAQVKKVDLTEADIIISGGRSLKSADNFINCGTTCAKSYAQGTAVSLTATPDSAQWRFAGWSGDCSGNGVCSLIMNATKNVKALFITKPLIYQEF
jgi:electron transfer flavoprotein alpha subunit